MPLNTSSFKGTVSRDLLLLFFFMNQFPPSPWVYDLGRFEFFRKLRRYSQLKVDHRCQRHRWQICNRCQRHQLPPVSVVLLIPVANLPPVSTIPAANVPPVPTTPANCHRCQRHQWQTMRLISGWGYLKVNWRQKFIYVNSTIQRCSNKIIKIFLI